MDQVAEAAEAWVEAQGLTMPQLKSANRSRRLVEARRRIARYLRQHGWSTPEIGRFIDRDHTTILYLLQGGAS